MLLVSFRKFDTAINTAYDYSSVKYSANVPNHIGDISASQSKP